MENVSLGIDVEMAERLVEGTGTLDDLWSFVVWEETPQGHDYWQTFADVDADVDDIIELPEEAIDHIQTMLEEA